ncbi:MAG: histidine kinase [Chitinophagaceae bacterium]|jgi:ligand-binding sensor domain-containing protein/signal transduction histidine kinase|nr:histidine kinase [Chitinophagaceae bacterium]
MFYRFLFCCLLIVASRYIHAQPYYFRHYQVENGLSNNAVICSLQDKKGFLWFGTKDGLNRFDGYTFKIFRNNPADTESIGNNFIHSLLEDANERLWVGTENGLYRYDPRVEKFYKLPFNEIGIVRDIQIDKENNLWFVSNFILYSYNISSGKLISYLTNDSQDVTSVCITNDNNIWISTSNGLIKQFNKKNNQFIPHNTFPTSIAQSLWIEKIYATQNGEILLATNKGVKLFSCNDFSCKNLITKNSDGTEIFVRNFLQTNNDEYWIATENGIFIYNTKTGKQINLSKKYNNPYSISDNAVYNICKDKEGGIWAGTYFGGINYLPDYSINFQKYFPVTGENSLSGNVVREIHEDKYKRLWIGTEDGGLNVMDKLTNSFTCFRPTGKSSDIAYTNIHGLLINDNEIWIGTFEHGLDVMDINTGKVIKRYTKGNAAGNLKSNFIYCLHKTIDKQILVGTTNGAFRYVPQKNSFEPLQGLPSGGWYSSLYTDDENNVWAGTYGNGLYFYNDKEKILKTFRYNAKDASSISSDRINYIFQDADKTIWIATENGLCKYQNAKNNFQRYGTNTGFPSNFILSILQDDNKNLWISTTKGLVKLNSQTGNIEVFTKEKGLLTDQFNFNSAYKDEAGKLYFGTVKGFISFNPNERKVAAYTPKIYFTDFQINNSPLAIGAKGSPLKQSISFTNNIELKYDQSTFGINFSALSFTAPETFGYMYKMEGLPNNAWTYLQWNRTVFFTELKPGNYTFLVKEASNVSNVPVTSLHIIIRPPWWLSIVAKIFYTLAIILTTYFLVKEYHRRIKEKHDRKLEQMDVQKSKELYEAKMEFFTNITHEIKTPLTLIKGPLDRILKTSENVPADLKSTFAIMERNTERLLNLTNQILDFRQAETKGFAVNVTEVNLSGLLKELLTSFKLLAEQNKIIFHNNKIPKNIIALIDVDAFEKILNNLLSNAIKYAHSKIFFEVKPINISDNTITIEIKNDGYIIPYEHRDKIFEPFFRSKGSEKTKGAGIGLALAKSLTELHKGTLTLLYTEKNWNTFSLTIPLNNLKIWVPNQVQDENEEA